MIIYNNSKEDMIRQAENSITELKEIRQSYSNRIELCIKCMENINDLKVKTDSFELEKLYEKTQVNLCTFLKEITLVDATMGKLDQLKEKDEIMIEDVNHFNEGLQKLKKDYMNHSIYSESVMIDFVRLQNRVLTAESGENAKQEEVDDGTVKTNGTLLISEVKQKVILPYTKEEVMEILRSNPEKYENPSDVIEKVFTVDFSRYEHQASARFKEAYDLITKREKYSKIDGISLGIEMFHKRLLHPAIITACRTLDELDVYLDCLEKNELDDFKIFDIAYELHPALVKEGDSFWKNLFAQFFPQKEKN